MGSAEQGFSGVKIFSMMFTHLHLRFVKDSQIHCRYLYLIVFALSLVKNNGERELVHVHADLSEDSYTMYKFTSFNDLACI